MILGVSARAASFGWALLDDAATSFVDLGVVQVSADDAVALVGALRPDKCERIEAA